MRKKTEAQRVDVYAAPKRDRGPAAPDPNSPSLLLKGTSMTKLRAFAQAEHASIRAYALEHGRYWKARLRDDWMNARTTGLMQALRNSHGQSWLVSFPLTRHEQLAGPVGTIFPHRGQWRYIRGDHDGSR